jgi:methylphosphotriester-DNA--protein-cysteine methyltransferase
MLRSEGHVGLLASVGTDSGARARRNRTPMVRGAARPRARGSSLTPIRDREQVPLLVGSRQPARFAKAFRRAYGVTPARYREGARARRWTAIN